MIVENISWSALHERMLPTSAGVESATFWSPFECEYMCPSLHSALYKSGCEESFPPEILLLIMQLQYKLCWLEQFLRKQCSGVILNFSGLYVYITKTYLYNFDPPYSGIQYFSYSANKT